MLEHVVPRIILTLVVSAFFLQGCANNNSAGLYTSSQAQREQIVRMGTVQSVRKVTIDSGQTGLGAATGGALGAIAAGANIGKGNGSLVSGIVGGVAGLVAGHAVEGALSKKAGFEITVLLDSKELRAITQAADEVFTPGERVRLVTGSDGITRVTH